MISYAEALQILRRAAAERRSLPPEEVPLAEASGRVASRTIFSAEPLPPFDNASMDGYAVLAADTAPAVPRRPLRLPVLGAVAAGDAPGPASKGGAYEIGTGAPLPAGLDAVIRIEDVRVIEDGKAVEIQAPAEAGDYVRRAGQDFRAGTPVLEAGTRLGPRHLLALAALGHDAVPVRRRPKVALISTGKELVDPGLRPGPGQIRNATASFLVAALPLAGAEAVFVGTVPDDPEDFRRRIKEALGLGPDLIVTTGAVSMGRQDFIAGELRGLGAEILYHKVAIRPGKPGLVAGFHGGPLLFGLPGNPVSTVVGLRFFLLPFLRLLLGQPEELPLRARLSEDAPKPEGLRCFYKAVLAAGPGGAEVRALAGQASFQVRPLLDANAWLVLPEDGDVARAGGEAEVLPLWPDDEAFPVRSEGRVAA